MTLGLCVSPGFIPDQRETNELNPAFLRSILINVVDDLEALISRGRPILLTLNNQADMVAGWNGWEEALTYIGQRARSRLIGVTAANELDVYWSRNQDDVPPSFAADLVNRAQTVLRPLGIPVGTTSLGGPRWPEYLEEMLRQCEPDFAALNPYGWIFDGIDAKIASLRSVAPGLPIKFPELGCKIGDAGGEVQQADALRIAAAIVKREGIDAAWFAWHDLVGAPDERGDSAFGLVAEDGRRRPAWSAFAALASVNPEPVVVPAPPEVPVPTTPNPWQHFTAEQIAEASGCPADAITMYWPKIVEQLDHCGINDRATQVAAIGTIAIETASTFRPIHEFGTPADWAGYSGGATYAGRGFIQLTHDYNYAAYGQAVDELWHAGGAIDLVARPDDALNPEVAAAVLACYFRDHTTAQGYSIPQAANDGDWTWVRRLVQGGTAGLDRLVAVAGALQAAPEPAPVTVADDPRDERIRGLETAVAHLADVVVPKAARAAQDADAAIAEAQSIREQFLGAKPAA